MEGHQCPLCDALERPQDDDEAIVVADLEVSRLRLARNQFVKGYCVLVSRIHVKEPFELPEHARCAFFEDLMRAGEALQSVFAPIKMNYQILGNQVPHLHAHLVPRYPDDGAPGAPLAPGDGRRELPPHEFEARAEAIRAAMRGG